MPLDLPTLLVATVAIIATIGLVLLFAWAQDREATALLWWGTADLVGALAAALLCARGYIPDPLSVELGNAVLFAAYAAFWGGARRFEHRTTPPAWMIAGAGLWLIACVVPTFRGSMTARIVLASCISAAYILAAAGELWRGREPLRSRGPAVALLVAQGLVFLGRLPFALAWPVPDGAVPFRTPWFSIMAFESLLHGIALSFLLLGLTRDRAELEQRITARTDPLTGIANRRAFMDEAGRRLDRWQAAGEPAVLLLFDLDHFKQVNDTLGHDAGDHLLVAFAAIAQGRLGPEAVFGRLGGEEFAALLPGPVGAALPPSEAIRAALGRLGAEAGGPVPVSVSVGLAASEACGHGLDGLLARADRALYRAKALGRDQVAVDALAA